MEVSSASDCMAWYGEQPQRWRTLCRDATWSIRACRCSVRVLCRFPSCGSRDFSFRTMARTSWALSCCGVAVPDSWNRMDSRPRDFQLAGHFVQAGAPVPHHQDGPSGVHQGADGVDGGLGLAGARRAADHQRVPGAGGVNDVLLVRVGVQQEQFVGGVPLVHAREAGQGPAPRRQPLRRRAAVARAATSGLASLIQGSSRLPERSAKVETSRLCCASAPWMGLMRVASRSRTGCGIEAGGAVGEAGDGVDVEDNAVDGLQVPDQRRIDVRLLGELQLVVVFARDGRSGRSR